MKKLLFIIPFLLICSLAEAATTYTAVAGGGNWNNVATWGGGGYPIAGDTAVINATMTGTVTVNASSACAVLNLTNNGGTLAFGTQTLTVSGLATLQGAMTSTSGTLAVAGGVTLLSTITGTFPLLKITGASTLTSGGFTWPGALTLNIAGAVVLSGNWINTGLVTYASATNLNKTAAETLTCNGGLTMTSASGTTPTATIILGGGTWSGSGSLYNSLTFNCATAVVSGTVVYRVGTLTYTAGTITTTSSTLQLPGNCTLNTNGITWNDIYISAGSTYILGSNLTCAGSLYIAAGLSITFSGAYDISCGTFKNIIGTGNATWTFVAGQTLTITTNLYLAADPASVTNITIKSDTTHTHFHLNYGGTTTNCKVFRMTFTDVDASGSAQVIDNWYGGTLTETTNITNRTSADIGGGGTGSISVSTNF